MIPKLTRLLFSSIRTGAEWVTEVFIAYCEMVVQAFVRAILAVLVAIALIQASIRFDNNTLLILGVAVGGLGLLYFAVISALGRMAVEKLSQFSPIARAEIERLSNIFFLFIVTLFYLGIDQGQRHPILLKAFLGMVVVLYVIAISPGKSRFMVMAKSRLQVAVLVPVVLMAIFASVPEAITKRVTDNHWPEKVTGTVSTEIPFRIDEQDQIFDLTTNQPMELFQRVSSNGEAPKARKGWTRDKKGNYHLWTWFDGQANSTPMGQEIMPVTPAKVDDIVIETKRTVEQKLAEEKRVADEQKALADAETARLKEIKDKEEQELKIRRELEEIARQQQEERELLARQQAEAERIAWDLAQREAHEERHRLANQPVLVSSTILAPTGQSQDVVLVKPSDPFTYREMLIPDESVIVLGIAEVKETSDKNRYELMLQPQTIMSGGQSYDISRQTDIVSFIVKKDNSNSVLKILGGIAVGTAVGAAAGGKKGAIAGAVIGGAAGTVYAMASHGKKFQMVVGDQLPLITIKPVP